MKIKSISKKLFVERSPFELFGSLTSDGQQAHCALLETADAGSLIDGASSSAKSILMLSAAARISAKDGLVKIEAFSENGEEFIKALHHNQKLNELSCVSVEENQLTLAVIKPEMKFDEELRLKQNSSFSVLKVIRALLQTGNEQDDESSMLLGVISFDAIDEFENYPQVDKQIDDYSFYLAEQLIIQNRQTNAAEVVIKSFGNNADNPIHQAIQLEKIIHQVTKVSARKLNDLMPTKKLYKADINDEEFAQQVAEAKQHIIDGDVFQLVLARTFSMECEDPFTAYGVLRNQNPSPYMYFINFGERILFGASPESCLKVDEQQEVLIYPIAGTRPRGINNQKIDKELDCKIEFELISDEKENSEHMMLLDLARNDIAKIVEVGTRQVSKLKQIAKYSQVMHMVSEVKGELRSDLDALDAYKACANMGTLTGAPKIEAMKLIRHFEQSARGLYGGAVCVYNAKKVFDSAIIIRSAVVENGRAYITAGAGVVHDSNPQAEAQETLNKAKALIKACSYQKQTSVKRAVGL